MERNHDANTWAPVAKVAQILMSHSTSFQMIATSTSNVGTRLRDIPETQRKFPARILVVDDERLVRWAITETLGEQGYEVAEAGDGESAMRAVISPDAAPALVLLDLCLPDCDDLRVLSFIRAHAPATPIVLMTAYATPEITDQAIGLGASVVNKPFDMTELPVIVERALASKAA